jgi:hypothetical protein
MLIPKAGHGGVSQVHYIPLEGFIAPFFTTPFAFNNLKELEFQLEEAIEEERYEDAAIIKKKIDVIPTGYNTDLVVLD